MTADTLQVHAAAIAVATELTLGRGDMRVIETLVESLPAGAVAKLIVLVDIYTRDARENAPSMLSTAGLAIARAECADTEP